MHFVGVPKGLPHHGSHCDDSLLQDPEEERIESPDRRAAEHFALVAKKECKGIGGCVGVRSPHTQYNSIRTSHTGNTVHSRHELYWMSDPSWVVDGSHTPMKGHGNLGGKNYCPSAVKPAGVVYLLPDFLP